MIMDGKVSIATGNLGKFREMKPIFEEKGVSLNRVDVDISEIDSMSVEKVARKKVKDSYNFLDEKPTAIIVEDTGFFVQSLNGFPGVEAAYFAETAGVDKLLKLLEDENNRKAYFKTAIAYYDGEKVRVFTGKMKGVVPKVKKGKSKPSLPYNSYFVPKVSGNESLAENPKLKDENFHRNKATREFLDWYTKD